MTINNEWEPSDIRLSPTKINDFYMCNFKFFLKYIKKVKEYPTIHMIRGRIIHQVLEEIFKNEFPYAKKWDINDVIKWTHDRLEELWMSGVLKNKAMTKNYDDIVLSQFQEETEDMLTNFVGNLDIKMQELIKWGVADSMYRAYNALKPRFSEYRLTCGKFHILGYLDTVLEDFDGNITIEDYKTSKKYNNWMPEDYYRQLLCYAVMYNETFNKPPDFASINWLRYDRSYFLKIRDSDIKEGEKIIMGVHNKLKEFGITEKDEKNYEPCPQKLCGWCTFQDKLCPKEWRESFGKENET